MERSGASGDPGVGVLVAFESRKGSTREIVETIAAEIRTAGWDVDVIEIMDSPRPEEYGYVIIGGPLHMGKIKGVRDFVDMHESVLQERLVGAFAVGMTFASPDEEEQAPARKILDDAIAPLAGEHLGYFPGKIDMQKLSLIEKAIIKIVKSPVGDHRDWTGVKNWAQVVVKEIEARSGPS
jgi:menaquinone-dependent protoporphyrinogen oxidase